MLKPLSQKTIDKKYSELGLSKAKTDMLHKYFLCFSNLYGIITVRDAWDIFKHYEGTDVSKKDFVAFSGIVQREAGLSYSVYEMKDIYSEEKDDPLDRMIVNNRLVSFGYYKFQLVYRVAEYQGNKPYYIPEKQILESFIEDRFYLTPYGNSMKLFIEKLRTSGIGKDFKGTSDRELTDLNGMPIKGKCLSECVFLTREEKFDIDYYKDNVKKQKLFEIYNVPASEKILKRIEDTIMTGNVFDDQSPLDEMKFLIDFLNECFGVELSKAKTERFLELYTKLNNNSNLWLNCGWSPEKLAEKYSNKMPRSLLIGPNLKNLFDSGEMDREQFENRLARLGLSVTDN